MAATGILNVWTSPSRSMVEYRLGIASGGVGFKVCPIYVEMSFSLISPLLSSIWCRVIGCFQVGGVAASRLTSSVARSRRCVASRAGRSGCRYLRRRNATSPST